MTDTTEPLPHWFWEDDRGAWVPFDDESSALIEAIYSTKGTTVDVGDYLIDIPNRKQRNVNTGREWRIRR